METNKERLEKITKDCDQLVGAFNDLKTVIASLIDINAKLGKLAEIRGNRLSYDENKNAPQQ